MGHNRSGVIAKKRMLRRRKEEARLARKDAKPPSPATAKGSGVQRPS
jgi:hypothetical protein